MEEELLHLRLAPTVPVAAEGDQSGIRPSDLRPVVIRILHIYVSDLFHGDPLRRVVPVGKEHHGVVGYGDELQLHAGRRRFVQGILGGLGGGKEDVDLPFDETVIGIKALGVALRELGVIGVVGEQGPIHRHGIGIRGGRAVDHRHLPVKPIVDRRLTGIPGQLLPGPVEKLYGLSPLDFPVPLRQVGIGGRAAVRVVRPGLLHGLDEGNVGLGKGQVSAQGPARDLPGVVQRQVRRRPIRDGEPAHPLHGPGQHHSELAPGDRPAGFKVLPGLGDPGGLGGGGCVIIPVLRLHVGIARVSGGLQAQQPAHQRKCLRPGERRPGIQAPRLVPLDHAPVIEVAGAVVLLIEFHVLPVGDTVGKAMLLSQERLQGAARLVRRHRGKDPLPPHQVAGESHRLAGVGIAHRQPPALRPVQLRPFRAGHPQGHIASVSLHAAPKRLLPLCRQNGGAQQRQAQPQGDHPSHFQPPSPQWSCGFIIAPPAAEWVTVL